MRDKRPVDELSIEELERILAIRKREDRQKRLKRMGHAGRVIETQPPKPPPKLPPPSSKPTSSAATAQRDNSPRFEDDVDSADYAAKSGTGKDEIWRTFVNRALLAVEVLAVVGLIYLGLNMVGVIGRLEEETASAQSQAEEIRREGIPTLEPTPQLRLSEIVLPGGHTPPTEPGGGQFNYAEIPAHLLPLVQEQLAQPVIERPPITSETALRLIIPRINVDHTIIQGVDEEALRQGIGQLQNGVNPSDDEGNLVLSAHNDVYSEIFRHLDELEAGDQFQIQTQTQIFTYTVTGWEVVGPLDVHVLDNRGGATATLISCYPYQVDNRRIIVFAYRDDEGV